MTTEILAAIDAPHFYCGVVLVDGRVIAAAPIVRYMTGWTRDRVRTYCVAKNWKVRVVHQIAHTK